MGLCLLGSGGEHEEREAGQAKGFMLMYIKPILSRDNEAPTPFIVGESEWGFEPATSGVTDQDSNQLSDFPPKRSLNESSYFKKEKERWQPLIYF